MTPVRFRAASVLVLWMVVLGGSQAAAGPWEGFTAVAISPDGTRFLTGGRTGEVLWGEVSTGEIGARWNLGTGITAVGFDAQGPWAATADGRAFALRSGEGPRALVPPPQTGSTVPPAPLVNGVSAGQGDWSAKGGPDGWIVVTRAGVVVARWQAHDAVVTGLAWGPGGAFLLSCSLDGTLALWDPTTGRVRGRL